MDEFKARFALAKQHRRQVIETSAREVYKYCFNGRESEWDQNYSRTAKKDDDRDEIFTDAPATIAEEFAGELFNTMTPENAPWVEYQTGTYEEGDLPDGLTREDIESEIKEFEEGIDKALSASNYYDEGWSAFQDATVGNVVMWAERPTLNSAIVFEAVPLGEVWLRLGYGGLDDRFRQKYYAYSDLPALFPDGKFPREIKDKIDKKSKGNARVCWGFWKSYADPENPVWVQNIRVDDKPIGLDEEIGPSGACPMIVGRYNPEAGSAWGRGPGVRMLPTIRVLDELTAMGLEALDKNLDPAIIYPADGTLDLSDGIESGMAYPAMPGSADAIRELGISGNLDYGFYSEERMIERVRYGFYRDFEQRGKTPPSATQVMNEEQKALRRLARPAAKLWSEFGVGILKRVEFLEREAGGSFADGIAPLLDSGIIIARPISPLERAQAREEVMVAQTLMDMATQYMGEQAPLLIDGTATFMEIKAKLKDKLVTFRSQEELMQMAQAMMQQQQQPQQGAAPNE